MQETLTLNGGTVFNGNAILAGDLFLYIYEQTLRRVFEKLIEPGNTAKIAYTQVNGETILFSGYTRLVSVRDEEGGLITAVLKKEA